jgi:predicted negative regulator of RcsB-dependent stress response
VSYETDDEKVEAIKKWWRENGLSVVLGAALGLGGIYGWRFWVGYQQSVASQASTALEQLMNDATGQQTEAVAGQARKLREDYGSTPYPALASMVAARVLYESGKASDAMSALQQAVDSAPEPALAHIAALRLARIQIAESQVDAAEKTLQTLAKSAAFAGERAALLGDIAAARGDMAAARAAYEEAIAKDSSLSQLIRLKIDNLPPAA